MKNQTKKVKVYLFPVDVKIIKAASKEFQEKVNKGIWDDEDRNNNPEAFAFVEGKIAQSLKGNHLYMMNFDKILAIYIVVSFSRLKNLTEQEQYMVERLKALLKHLIDYLNKSNKK